MFEIIILVLAWIFADRIDKLVERNNEIEERFRNMGMEDEYSDY